MLKSAISFAIVSGHGPESAGRESYILDVVYDM